MKIYPKLLIFLSVFMLLFLFRAIFDVNQSNMKNSNYEDNNFIEKEKEPRTSVGGTFITNWSDSAYVSGGDGSSSNPFIIEDLTFYEFQID